MDLTEDRKAYFASREWALLREAVRERSGNKCERCLLAPMQATHHLTYARYRKEMLDDLQAVCHPCHAYLSGKASYDPAASGCSVIYRMLRTKVGVYDKLWKTDDSVSISRIEIEIGDFLMRASTEDIVLLYRHKEVKGKERLRGILEGALFVREFLACRMAKQVFDVAKKIGYQPGCEQDVDGRFDPFKGE